MRVELEARALLGMLKEARSPIPSVPDSPAAAAVEISVSDGMVRVTGQGPSGSVQATARCEGEWAAGSALVLPKPLESLLRSLGGRGIVVGCEHEQLVVACEGMQDYHFRRLESTLGDIGHEWGEEMALDTSRLTAAIAAVKRSADPDDHAVQMRVSDHRLILEATDNYRLSQSDVDEVEHEDASVVLSMTDLEAAARSGADRVSFSSDMKAVRLSGQGVVRSVRALNRPFPPLDGLISRHMPHQTSVQAEALAEALRRLHSVAQGRPVDLRIGESIEIRGENPDVGSGREMVEVEEGGGGEIEMSVRSEYLLDVAESCRGLLRIQYSEPSSAVRFQDERSSHVVMPIRRA